MAHRHHTIDYIEIPVSDVSSAKAFYGAAFGWVFTDYGPDYAGIQGVDGGDEVGGLNGSAEAAAASGRTGGPLVLLWSDDLDATVTAVTDAGGVVTNGPYEFPGGRRFHFTDPSGNELGAWQAAATV